MTVVHSYFYLTCKEFIMTSFQPMTH